MNDRVCMNILEFDTVTLGTRIWNWTECSVVFRRSDEVAALPAHQHIGVRGHFLLLLFRLSRGGVSKEGATLVVRSIFETTPWAASHSTRQLCVSIGRWA